MVTHQTHGSRFRDSEAVGRIAGVTGMTLPRGERPRRNGAAQP
jgi:hypothetical protein